jgi:hypothetical protein
LDNCSRAFRFCENNPRNSAVSGKKHPKKTLQNATFIDFFPDFTYKPLSFYAFFMQKSTFCAVFSPKDPEKCPKLAEKWLFFSYKTGTSPGRGIKEQESSN